MLKRHFAKFAGLMIVIAAAVGCSRPPIDLGYVQGIVTVDGEPASRVSVLFEPDSGGRPSVGVTDNDGRYVLYHTSEFQGAELGQHSVRLRLMSDSPFYQEPKLGPKSRMGAMNSGAVSLDSDSRSKTVVEGSQTFDFPLELSQLQR